MQARPAAGKMGMAWVLPSSWPPALLLACLGCWPAGLQRVPAAMVQCGPGFGPLRAGLGMGSEGSLCDQTQGRLPGTAPFRGPVNSFPPLALFLRFLPKPLAPIPVFPYCECHLLHEAFPDSRQKVSLWPAAWELLFTDTGEVVLFLLLVLAMSYGDDCISFTKGKGHRGHAVSKPQPSKRTPGRHPGRRRGGCLTRQGGRKRRSCSEVHLEPSIFPPHHRQGSPQMKQNF